MEQKNRLIIAATVIVLIVGALLASFGRSWLALRTPPVQLPSVDPSAGEPGDLSSPVGAGQYQPVSVTTQTVQSVIATLSREDSSYRELTVETFWDGGSYASPVQVWTDDGWSHSRQTLPTGLVRHEIVGNGALYYWYEGYGQYQIAPAGEGAADLSQRIPTYETVLDLDPASITAAGYEVRGEIPCVYVEVRLEEPDVIERYWVGVDSGLLVSAETEQAGELAYRMTAYGTVTAPCPADASFALPDGTVLHALS